MITLYKNYPHVQHPVNKSKYDEIYDILPFAVVMVSHLYKTNPTEIIYNLLGRLPHKECMNCYMSHFFLELLEKKYYITLEDIETGRCAECSNGKSNVKEFLNWKYNTCNTTPLVKELITPPLFICTNCTMVLTETTTKEEANNMIMLNLILNDY